MKRTLKILLILIAVIVLFVEYSCSSNRGCNQMKCHQRDVKHGLAH